MRYEISYRDPIIITIKLNPPSVYFATYLYETEDLIFVRNIYQLHKTLDCLSSLSVTLSASLYKSSFLSITRCKKEDYIEV